MNLAQKIKSAFAKPTPLPAGFHTLRGQTGKGGNYRLHLRIEPDGSGVLIINAAKVIKLNQTAAEFVKLMIDGLSEEQVVKTVASRYKVKKDEAAADFHAFKEKVDCLIESDDVCPVEVLEFEGIEPFSMPVSAPYRMDLALTHRCNLNCSHCYAGGPRETSELDTAKWKQVIGKLFAIGIPHICFTGGEATLREDLPELIAHAEDLGLVTGLLTNGCRLSDRDYVKCLLGEGLDHVQITIESHAPAIHNAMVSAEGHAQTVAGIKNSIELGLYTVTNTTITQKNAALLVETLQFLHGLGVERFAMNGLINAGRGRENPDALTPVLLQAVLEKVTAAAEILGMRMIWYTPTRYCEMNPLELGLGLKRCTAGHYNMCVEPDGSVLPCQSYYSSVGNILTDDWNTIWNHDLLTKIRSREWAPEECKSCDDLQTCGGGCPLEKDGAPLCADSLSNF